MRLRSGAGEPVKLPPPVEGYLASLPPQARAIIDHLSQARAVGGAETIRSKINSFIERTRADELILSGATFDPAARCRSLELTMEALGG